jgi:hypothetical protein
LTSLEPDFRPLLNALTGAVVRALRKQDAIGVLLDGPGSEVLAALAAQHMDGTVQLVVTHAAPYHARGRSLARHLRMPLMEVVPSRADAASLRNLWEAVPAALRPYARRLLVGPELHDVDDEQLKRVHRETGVQILRPFADKAVRRALEAAAPERPTLLADLAGSLGIPTD